MTDRRAFVLLGALAAGCAKPTVVPRPPTEPQSQVIEASAGAQPPASASSGSVAPVVDRTAIDNEVRARLADIRACYDVRAAARPELEGIVTATFLIDGAGLARRVELTSGEIEDRELEGCLRGILESMQFPAAPRGEQVAVTYPFDFRPR